MFERSFFAASITESHLMEWAGERYFARGAAYFEDGTVVQLSCDDGGIQARVFGTQPYAVRFWRDGRKLRWGCSCPLGVEEAFCKHLVAVGLAFLSGTGAVEEAESVIDPNPVRQLLDELPREELVELVAGRAAWDKGLAVELLLAGRARPRKSPLKKKGPSRD